MKMILNIFNNQAFKKAATVAGEIIVQELSAQITEALIKRINKDENNVQLHSKSLPNPEPQEQTPRLRLVSCGEFD